MKPKEVHMLACYASTCFLFHKKRHKMVYNQSLGHDFGSFKEEQFAR